VPKDSQGDDTAAQTAALANMLKAVAAGYTGSSTFLSSVLTGAN